MSAGSGFWGERGAGCIVRATSTGRMLLGLRSAEVDHPLTWGTWGGAVDPGEDAEVAAMRELFEETGYDGEMRLEKIFTYRHACGFVYDTFLVEVPREFEASLCWETEEARWFEPGEWPEPLHFGLAAVIAARPEIFAPGRSASFLKRISELCRILGVRRAPLSFPSAD